MHGPGGSSQSQGGRVQNPWRGPLGAVALAVAATGYWSTVAWLTAARNTPTIVDVDIIDGSEHEAPALGAGDFPLLKVPHDDFGCERKGSHPFRYFFDYDPRPRPLGLFMERSFDGQRP
jgi:hypothetical protein